MDVDARDYEEQFKEANIRGCDGLLSRLIEAHGALGKIPEPESEPEPDVLEVLPAVVLKTEPTRGSVERFAGYVAVECKKRHPTVADIKKCVARFFEISTMDLDSKRRTAKVVLPRQIGMYLAKTLTLRSFPDIGMRFGGRDHTTALHSFRKIEALLRSDEKLAADIETIKAGIMA